MGMSNNERVNVPDPHGADANAAFWYPFVDDALRNPASRALLQQVVEVAYSAAAVRLIFPADRAWLLQAADRRRESLETSARRTGTAIRSVAFELQGNALVPSAPPIDRDLEH